MTIKSIVKKASRIICVSEHTKEDALKMLGVSVDKVRVVYEGISEDIKPVTDQAALDNLKKKYNINEPYFLYTGAWRKHKNLANLIKAFNLYRNMHDTNSALVLAGKVDPAYKEVTEAISEYGLAGHVIMPGFIPDEELPTLYSAANAFIFPSLYEGFGLPPLEAMACGCPVAVSNVSSLPEICGNAAIYFEPEDPEKICEAMHKIVEPETRKKMVEIGFQHAKTFSWSDMTTNILNIYKEVFIDIEKEKVAALQEKGKSTKSASPKSPNTASPEQPNTQQMPSTPVQQPVAPNQPNTASAPNPPSTDIQS